MGMFDRDYWRERHNKRSGYRERARFRQSTEDADDLSDHAYFRGLDHKAQQKPRTWHPVLQVLLFVLVCLAVMFTLDVLK